MNMSSGQNSAYHMTPRRQHIKFSTATKQFAGMLFMALAIGVIITLWAAVYDIS